MSAPEHTSGPRPIPTIPQFMADDIIRRMVEYRKNNSCETLEGVANAIARIRELEYGFSIDDPAGSRYWEEKAAEWQSKWIRESAILERLRADLNDAKSGRDAWVGCCILGCLIASAIIIPMAIHLYVLTHK